MVKDHSSRLPVSLATLMTAKHPANAQAACGLTHKIGVVYLCIPNMRGSNMPGAVKFNLVATDPRTKARLGRLETPHGDIQTPVFMPVGTQGAVRSMSPDQVMATGTQILLANTYHMHLRPGEDLVKKAGGLHAFMGYSAPILTDSGGFQVFSLPKKEIAEEGVRFKHEYNGNEVFLSPEISMQIQMDLGADIAMAFDECVPYPSPKSYVAQSIERTARWEARSRKAHNRPDQALFGIVQGGAFEDLRARSAKQITDLGFDGYAIGGLSVGEGRDIMCEVLDYTVDHLPADHARYLMGVGLPEDLLEGVERGIDMFDCVVATRHGRSGLAYSYQGRLRLSNSQFRRDMYPIDTNCKCYTCQNFSRAYIKHLLDINEVLSATLVSIHNVFFLHDLMKGIRTAIAVGSFLEFKAAFYAQYLKPTAKKEASDGPRKGRKRGGGKRKKS